MLVRKRRAPSAADPLRPKRRLNRKGSLFNAFQSPFQRPPIDREAWSDQPKWAWTRPGVQCSGDVGEMLLSFDFRSPFFFGFVRRGGGIPHEQHPLPSIVSSVWIQLVASLSVTRAVQLDPGRVRRPRRNRRPLLPPGDRGNDARRPPLCVTPLDGAPRRAWTPSSPVLLLMHTHQLHPLLRPPTLLRIRRLPQKPPIDVGRGGPRSPLHGVQLHHQEGASARRHRSRLRRWRWSRSNGHGQTRFEDGFADEAGSNACQRAKMQMEGTRRTDRAAAAADGDRSRQKRTLRSGPGDSSSMLQDS
eukprot:scaffold131_cov335-Pavlova_lutheri.AAC.43